MLCKSVKDPAKEAVGTGPFVLESISAEDRAVLKKNPTYWGKDAEGNQLPYLDEIDFVYSPDTAGQISGLQGGSLNWVGGLSSEQKHDRRVAAPSLKTESTDDQLLLRAPDPRRPGPGQGARVPPGAHGRHRPPGHHRPRRSRRRDRPATARSSVRPTPTYYLDQSVPYDPAKAKQLLADAGYANGVDIKVVAQTADPVPAVATAWQAQMKEIGVNVEIQQVPPDVYYADKGTDNWYQADFSSWTGARAPRRSPTSTWR